MAKKKTFSYEEIRALFANTSVPLVTVDKRWHELFPEKYKSSKIKSLEADVKSLVKKQGKLVNENKDLKRAKKKLMSDIVKNMEDAENPVIKKGKKLMEELNEKILINEDELAKIPYELREANEKLMAYSMLECYERMLENREKIDNIKTWLDEVKEQVKEKKVKQLMLEEDTQKIYSYLHDLVGPEAMNRFDKDKKIES